MPLRFPLRMPLRQNRVSQLSQTFSGRREPHPIVSDYSGKNRFSLVLPLGWLLDFNDDSFHLLEDLLCIDSFNSSLERAIARHLSQIPEVTAVYFHREDEIVHVWTVLSVNNGTTRRKVYEQEAKIIDELPEQSIYFRTTDPHGEATPKSEGFYQVGL